MLVLIEKLSDIHAGLFGYEQKLTEEDLVSFIKIEFSRIGADTKITPREVIRDFIELLNIVHQNPDVDIGALLGSDEFSYAKAQIDEETLEKEFEEFEI